MGDVGGRQTLTSSGLWYELSGAHSTGHGNIARIAYFGEKGHEAGALHRRLTQLSHFFQRPSMELASERHFSGPPDKFRRRSSAMKYF